MSTHTPGPWTVDVEQGRPLEPAVKAGEFYVATAHDMGTGGADTLSNAHMMAAAPDLLASARELVATCEGARSVLSASIVAKLARAKAAIAKAKGRP